MPKQMRYILGSVILLLALGGGVALSLHFRNVAVRREVAAGRTQPLVSVERPVIKHTESDKLAWQIRLKEVQITHGSGLLSAQGIQEALIYNTSGQPMVRVTAQQVTGTAGGSDFTVNGHVTVVSYQGVVLSTDNVQWRQSQGKVLCPGQVTARSREAMFSTTGLTYDLNASSLQAPNQVNMYSGQNKILGKALNYNVNTGNFTLDSVQMIFNAEEAKRMMQEVQHP